MPRGLASGAAAWTWVAAALLAAGAARADLSDGIELTTRLDLEWAVDLGTGNSHELALTLQPELELVLPAGMELTAIGRLRGDAFDELEPGSPIEHEVSRWSRRRLVGTQAELELRELYLDARLGRAALRLGKQQVVWGEADGLKVLDVVNPQHFREFILPAFEDSRIPLWTVNVEIPLLRALTLQLLWIPDPTHHEIPEPDALFGITSDRLRPKLPAGIPFMQQQFARPGKWFEDSDAGARLSGYWRGTSFTLNYLYQFGDFPVLVRRLPTALGAPVVSAPEYRRLHVVGGTASRAFGNLTVRGEIGASLDRWLPVDDPADRDGIARTPDLGWVLGLDWFGFDETFVSFQLFQSWLPDHRHEMLRKSLDTNLTLVIRREFWNDRLAVETQLLQSWTDRDGLVRPRIDYEWRDDTTVSVGFDFFYGDENGIFGQYDSNDRLWVLVRFSR